MRAMWIKMLVALAMLAGGVVAADEYSAAARGFFEKLGKQNREEDYRALENWVFEPGLEDAVRRSRVEEGVWVVTGYESKYPHNAEKEVWAEKFLTRLEKELGNRGWAWQAAGQMLTRLDGYGELVAGVFVRGKSSEVNSQARDEARARQCFLKAMAMAREPADRAEAELLLAEEIKGGPMEQVTKLTDFGVLPEISAERSYQRQSDDPYLRDGRSPVIGADGEWRLPVLRERFEDAKSDGERIYWLLTDAGKISPEHAAQAKLALAEMWHGLLDVNQLAELGYVYLEGTKSADDPQAKGEFELHTLRDEETILVGKDGPERRLLPEQARYLGMLRELVAAPGTEMEVREDALSNLLEWLADRFRFDAAEEIAKRALERDPKNEVAKYFLLKEIGPDGMFLESRPMVAGREAEVEFLSRELTEQRFELWEMDVEKYVAQNGGQTRGRWDQNPWSADQKDFDRYRTFFKRVLVWQAPLVKRANHMQSKNRVKLPVDRAGRFLVVAMMGEKCSVLPVKVARTIVLSAGLRGESSSSRENDDDGDLFLIDAISGKPVEGATVVEVEGRREVISDHAGSLLGMGSRGGILVRREGLPTELLEVDEQGLGIEDAEEVRSFLVTSQPLYRPGQKVDYAGWLRRPNWRKSSPGDFEDEAKVRVKVIDPVGQVIHETELPLDDFDGFAGSFDLAEEMVLGDCKVELEVGILESVDPFADNPKEVNKWEPTDGWTIKVGEFRKPDFHLELKAGPQGGEFSATVKANYHSGEPVKGAAVKAKLRAYPVWEPTFPEKRWDRLFSAGYDWPLPPSAEVGGWEKWGVWPEYDESMWDREYGETRDIEVSGVTDGEGRATLVFPKDLPLLGIRDYSCTVRVGVQEFTGRSVGAESDFVYSGRDYEVLAQPEKGFYRVGESVKVTVWTMGANREAVAGNGKFTVEAIREGGKFEEVAKEDFTTGKDGMGALEFVPPGAGRYRCVAAAGGGERGFVLEVIGEGIDGYKGVKLIPSKSVGSEGERIEVLIATEQEEALVWLFEQMPDGLRRTPRMIETKHHTVVIEIPLTKAGAPDFFLQAATLVGERVEKGSCRIVMPPEESLLEVAMSAQPERGEPGGRAKVEIAVKNERGKPVPAALAVAAFDQALEDLGGRWPDATARMLDSFEGGGQVGSSQDREDYGWESEFNELYQAGIFFDRNGMVGKPPWRAEGQFVKPGSFLWVGYSPPELPNSVGSNDSFGSFPVTPATPTVYSRYARNPGREVALSPEEKAAMAGVALREKFADRAYWGAALKTDAEGKVRAEFDFPANLTSWRVRAWAFGNGRSYGDGQVDIAVSKPLQVRPLLPQAAVVGDELEVGAMVQNLSQESHDFQMTMEVDGLAGSARALTLAAGGEGKVVWKQKVVRAGTMDFSFRAKSVDGLLADGLEAKLAVAPRLTPVTISAVAEIRDGGREEVLELLPDEQVGKTTVRVTLEAHPAVSALSVLPDLVGYPYGCTEQTLNRFLPTLVAWKAAGDLGIDWDTMTQRFTHDETSLGWVKGRAAVGERPAKLNDAKVRSMIQVGLGRLQEKQGSDGSWGWFSADDQDGAAYMTALAVRGFEMAGKLGFKQESGLGSKGQRDPAESGVSWLKTWATGRVAKIEKDPVEAGALDAWVVYVLAQADEKGAPELKAALLKAADELPASGLLHLALAMNSKTEAAEMKRLRTMAEAAMREEKHGGWEWWRELSELRAWHLKLLVKMGEGRVELEREIRDLLKLRTDGIRWSCTKTSALCVEAIIEAAVASGGFDFAANEAIQVSAGADEHRETAELNRKNLWTAHFALPVEAVSGKPVRVEVKATGKKTVMATAAMGFNSTSTERMKATNAGLGVERRYFRVAIDGARQLLADGEKVASGDLIEVELKVAAVGERNYVHLRDPIPAGLEPLFQLSGYEGGAYRESRGGETDFFFSSLSPWNSVQKYQLRAVTKGSGRALPARAECMYAPELFGQSGLRVIEVE